MFQGKLIGLAGSIALLIFIGSANAEINRDGIDGGTTLTLGNGDGELFFSIFDPTAQNSLTLDLNVGVQSFLADPLAGVSVQSDALRDFIANGDASAMQWNVAGLNNGPGPGDVSSLFVLTTVGLGETAQGFASTNALGNALESGGVYLGAVNDLIGGDNHVVASTGAAFWGDGAWGENFGSFLPFSNAIPLSGMSEALMVMISAAGLENNPSLAAEAWRVDAASGTVSFGAPVPVPAALWLFVSGLFGLLVRGKV